MRRVEDRSKWAQGALVAALAVLLSGCWLQVGADGGHTRFNRVEDVLNRDNVHTLHAVWSQRVGDLSSVSEPIVSGNRVFVTSTESQRASVHAFDVATGTPAWEQELVAAPPPSVPVSVDAAPVAFVGDELWTGHSMEFDFPPGCDVGSDRLDPATGERLGSSPGFPSAAASSRPFVARVVRGDGTGCPPSGGPVLEVSRRGSDGSFTSWRSARPVGSSGNPPPTLTSDQVVVWGPGNTVDSYAAGGCGAPTCMPTWTATLDDPFGFISVPVMGAAGPVFVLAGNNLIALDRATGADLWRAPLSGLGADLALADGSVYVTSIDWGASDPEQRGQLQTFDADGCGAPTCGPLWSASTGSQTPTAPTVGGGVVYLFSGDGNLLAFDAAGCGAATCSSLLRMFVLSSGDLSLAGGRLFVNVQDQLVAYGPDPSG